MWARNRQLTVKMGVLQAVMVPAEGAEVAQQELD
jgi:hypothetical protein